MEDLLQTVLLASAVVQFCKVRVNLLIFESTSCRQYLVAVRDRKTMIQEVKRPNASRRRPEKDIELLDPNQTVDDHLDLLH